MNRELRVLFNASKNLVLEIADINVKSGHLLQNHIDERNTAFDDTLKVVVVLKISLIVVKTKLETFIHQYSETACCNLAQFLKLCLLTSSLGAGQSDRRQDSALNVGN
ncbi:hypothetical protein HG531_010543 [Fusarium graminearum]|nr:hypothetical protein HG531_010543 [Fusarium graminearum]